MSMQEVAGSEFLIEAELVLLAMGFVGPEKHPLIEGFGLETTDRGNIAADADYMSTSEGIFACGDSRRGQSLVVWAIWEGRECARSVDLWLMGETRLPSTPQLAS
jgi:glutamate synthase (NADPH/NADH) small chain